MPDEGDENFQAECLEPQVADRSLAALIKETDDLVLLFILLKLLCIIIE